MTICVFAGPTLPSGHPARDELDAQYLGPAAQGDVYLAARRKPWGIVIIDGYFERVPSVWHKEILWALSRGVHVFGGGSIGALRAVELEAFGMEGLGAVFEAYRSGALEGDDEVALLHAPADAGYRPLSEALVNVRWTLAAAERAGVLAPTTRAALVEVAREIFYPERSYSALLKCALKAGLPKDEVDALAAWLPDNRIDRKQADAVELLSHVRAVRQAQPGPKDVRFVFRHTDAFDQLRREMSDQADGAHGQLEPVLDELRLQGDGSYLGARGDALLRALALWIVEADGIKADAAALSAEVARFRGGHGLAGEGDVARWLEQCGLDVDQLARLLEDEARIGRVLALATGDLPLRLLEQLQLDGAYEALRRRARDKQALLAEHGVAQPTLADAGMDEEELFSWYFRSLGLEPPADPKAYARLLDLHDMNELRRLLLGEYCYRRLGGSGPSAS